MKRIDPKVTVLAVTLLFLTVSVGALLAIAGAGPVTVEAKSAAAMFSPDDPPRSGDQELAYLLVKLELRTRAVVAGHYARQQSSVPGVDILYKRWLTSNLILPAAVADGVFAEVVPKATGGRAWVKMVVDEPRNPNNRADDVAMGLFDEIKGGAPFAQVDTGQAFYYAEPIKTNKLCLRCHGEPAGAPDPSFPQFKKDGWKPNQIVGAVVARVASGVETPGGQ